MAKHVFEYLNNANSIWVDILNLKYGCWNVWRDSVPSNCSWFFRGLCKSVDILKRFCRINSVNPVITSLLFDPWCFGVPLAVKPTFINMNVEVTSLNVTDFISNGSWNLLRLADLFGEYTCDIVPVLGKVVPTIDNVWVWDPKPTSHNLSSSVYHFLNSSGIPADLWCGWGLIWKLRISPRIKHFLWLAFKGRIATSDFLNYINIGPRNACIFCGIHMETAEHIFHLCVKVKAIWQNISVLTDTHIWFPNGFSGGDWLTLNLFPSRIKSIIAVTSRFIWKMRCDAIFQHISPNFSRIACRAFNFAKDLSNGNKPLLGRKLVLCNFSDFDGPFLFLASNWKVDTQVGRIGFLGVHSNFHVSFASCRALNDEDWMIAELQAISMALCATLNNCFPVKHIFLQHSDILSIIHSSNHSCCDMLHGLTTSPACCNLRRFPSFMLSRVAGILLQICLLFGVVTYMF